MFCPSCGKPVPEGQQFCGGCGAAASSTAVAPPRKKASPIVVYGGGLLIALLLWVVLGSEEVANPFQQIAGSSAFEIRVSGTPGKRFSGSYMVMGGDGSSTSHTVQDVTPHSYPVPKAMMVSVAFQKQDTEGVLNVEILRNGEAIKAASTTADYGMVTIATQ
jgi:predicted nucleic acid-binding Zn ribbon protein